MLLSLLSHSLLSVKFALRMESDWMELAPWSSGRMLKPSWALRAKANIDIVRCQPWTHLHQPRGERRWPVNRYQQRWGSRGICECHLLTTYTHNLNKMSPSLLISLKRVTLMLLPCFLKDSEEFCTMRQWPADISAVWDQYYFDYAENQ